MWQHNRHRGHPATAAGGGSSGHENHPTAGRIYGDRRLPPARKKVPKTIRAWGGSAGLLTHSGAIRKIHLDSARRATRASGGRIPSAALAMECEMASRNTEWFQSPKRRPGGAIGIKIAPTNGWKPCVRKPQDLHPPIELSPDRGVGVTSAVRKRFAADTSGCWPRVC